MLQYPEAAAAYLRELRQCIEEAARRLSLLLDGKQVGILPVTVKHLESREAEVCVPSGVVDGAMLSGISMTCAAPAFLFLDHIAKLIAESPERKDRSYVLEYGGVSRIEVGHGGPGASNTRFMSWVTVRQYKQLPSGVFMIRAGQSQEEEADKVEPQTSPSLPIDPSTQAKLMTPSFREKLIEKALTVASNGGKFFVFEGIEVPIDRTTNIPVGSGLVHGCRDGLVCYLGVSEDEDGPESSETESAP